MVFSPRGTSQTAQNTFKLIRRGGREEEGEAYGEEINDLLFYLLL